MATTPPMSPSPLSASPSRCQRALRSSRSSPMTVSRSAYWRSVHSSCFLTLTCASSAPGGRFWPLRRHWYPGPTPPPSCAPRTRPGCRWSASPCCASSQKPPYISRLRTLAAGPSSSCSLGSCHTVTARGSRESADLRHESVVAQVGLGRPAVLERVLLGGDETRRRACAVNTAASTPRAHRQSGTTSWPP